MVEGVGLAGIVVCEDLSCGANIAPIAVKTAPRQNNNTGIPTQLPVKIPKTFKQPLEEELLFGLGELGSALADVTPFLNVGNIIYNLPFHSLLVYVPYSFIAADVADFNS